MPTFLFILKHQLAFWLLAIVSYALGRRLTQRLAYSSAWERTAFCTGLGLGLIAYLVLLLGVLHALYRSLLIAVLLLSASSCISVWKEIGHDLVTFCKARRNHWLALIVVTLLLVGFFLASLLPLYPPTLWDAISYHLAAAKIYAQAHALSYTVYLRFPVFPQLNEMLFTLMLLLGDDLSAQLVQFLMAILVGIALYSWGRRSLSPSVGLWAALLWLSNPLVKQLATSAYIDIGLTLFVTLALYAFFNWVHDGADAWLVVSAVMFGLAAGSKYLALFPLLCCTVFLLFQAIREDKWRGAAVFVSVAALVAAPWYLRNFYYSGNPTFPYLGSIFGYGPWQRADYVGVIQEQRSYGAGRDLHSLLLLPWNLAFHEGIFHEAREPLSPTYLFLLPPAILVALRDRYVRALLLSVSAYTLFWFSTVQVVRYLLLVVPLLSLAAAMALGRLLSWLPGSQRRVTRTLVAVAVSVIFVSVAWSTAAQTLPKQRPPITQLERRTYLEGMLEAYPVFEFLNQVRGSDYSVYSLSGANMAYFADGRFMGDWFGPARYSPILASLSDPQSLYSALRDLGANYFVANLEDFWSDRVDQVLDDPFLSGHMKLIYARPHDLLFQIVDHPSQCARSPELLKNRNFEEVPKSGTPEYWLPTGKPLIDTSGRFSHGGNTAVAVNENNWLTQRVAIHPGRLYLLSHFSRGTNENSLVRLEINWLSSNQEKMVGAGMRVVPVAKEWEQHRMALTAPEGAAWAVVYASMQSGPGYVWLDDFSLVELECK